MLAKKIDYNSLFVAISCMTGMIGIFFSQTLGITTGANIYVLIMELIVLILAFFNKQIKIYYNLYFLYLFLSILVIFIVSSQIYTINYNFPQLVLYSLLPLFICSQKINYKKTLKYILYISLIGLLNLDYIFDIEYIGLNTAKMASSYSAVISVIAAMFYVKFKEDKFSIIEKLLIFYNIYLFIELIISGNRGVVLELFIALFFLLFTNYNNKDKKIINQPIKKLIILLLAIITILLIYVNLDVFLLFFIKIFKTLFGKAPGFLVKSYSLLESGNLSNDRINLYITTLNLIKNRPFLGYGIETFSLNANYLWPHNFILQFLYEGGILFAIFPIYIFIKTTVKMLFKDTNLETYIIGLFLLVLVVPRYLVSMDVWQGPYVWLYLGFCTRFLTINSIKLKR